MPLNKCFPCLQHQNEEVITKLDCSNTVLSEAFPTIWEYERTLEELYLTSTRINNLPPELFYCQSLRILVVNNNNLESIPNAIGSLRQLQILNLSRNLISSVPDNIKSCKNLTHLDLSCNNLQRFPDAITSLISLQELLLNETYLEFLPANFGRLVNLKILELRLNNLITLPKSMARLSNLQRIDIGGNEFTELPEVIGELKQLRELWIDFNQIFRVPTNISKLHELQHFEANANCFDVLPAEICHWSNIEVFSVCTNSLESLPFSIGMLKSLVTFKCESNDLRELPNSISNLENLEELVVSHNQLQRLPTTIGMLRKLRFLFADGNELRSLPDEICSCTSLSVLSVSRNKIRELPQNIGHLTQLKVMNLVSNLLTTLPVSTLSLVNLTSLWLSDNQSQPLVPLQYVNSNTKTELTCFMLPQADYRLNDELRSKCNLNKSSGDYHLQEQNNDGDYVKHMGLDENTEMPLSAYVSHARRICFAPEATVLTETANSENYNTNNNNGKNKSKTMTVPKMKGIATNAEEQFGIRLMRSPTPYPKELRLMAKYVRNVQKLTHSNSATSNDDTYVIPNVISSNNCDTNILSNNNVQPVVPPHGGSVREIYEQPCTSQDIFKSSQPVISATMENSHLPNFQNQSQNILDGTITETTPQFYVLPTHYLASGNVHFINESKIKETASFSILSQPQQLQMENDGVLSNYYSTNNQNSALNMMQPPPYHIARVYTKKTPKDLTNYETMRHHQQQQQMQHKDLMDREQIDDNMGNNMQTVTTSQIDVDVVDAELYNINYNTYGYHNNSNSVNNNPNEFMHLNNVQANTIKATLKPNDDEIQVNEVEQALQNLKSNDIYTQQPNSINSSGTLISSRKTPWLFGVHRNPTVKQVTIKWETHAGFDIGEMPNKQGIFVSTLVPNTNASRLLCVNDKLLEIDGYDFTNITINDARKIILNAGPVINVMLSRI